tara:strand:+ start:1667 stop:1957 length:291 start_codon:yes stop_codon:yes gene_type:complete
MLMLIDDESDSSSSEMQQLHRAAARPAAQPAVPKLRTPPQRLLQCRTRGCGFQYLVQYSADGLATSRARVGAWTRPRTILQELLDSFNAEAGPMAL